MDETGFFDVTVVGSRESGDHWEVEVQVHGILGAMLYSYCVSCVDAP